MKRMPALSIRQPHAEQILRGKKKIEYRLQVSGEQWAVSGQENPSKKRYWTVLLVFLQASMKVPQVVNQSMSDVAISRNGVRIRLTGERWSHIVEEHRELADLRLEVLEAISSPVRIVEGGEGALLAVREIDLGKYLVVVYRELANDGFVITAFLTRRIRILERRKQLWP